MVKQRKWKTHSTLDITRNLYKYEKYICNIGKRTTLWQSSTRKYAKKDNYLLLQKQKSHGILKYQKWKKKSFKCCDLLNNKRLWCNCIDENIWDHVICWKKRENENWFYTVKKTWKICNARDHNLLVNVERTKKCENKAIIAVVNIKSIFFHVKK